MHEWNALQSWTSKDCRRKRFLWHECRKYSGIIGGRRNFCSKVVANCLKLQIQKMTLVTMKIIKFNILLNIKSIKKGLIIVEQLEIYFLNAPYNELYYNYRVKWGLPVHIFYLFIVFNNFLHKQSIASTPFHNLKYQYLKAWKDYNYEIIQILQNCKRVEQINFWKP